MCLRDTQCVGGACSPGPISRCYEPESQGIGDDCFYRGQCTTDQCLVSGKCGCAGSDANCPPDEWCDLIDVCRPVKAIGELCTGDRQCVTGVCDITCQECRTLPTKAGCNFATEYCQSKTCNPKIGIGGACGGDDQCQSGQCLAGECTKGCNADSDCPGQWCNELLGGCVDKKALGDVCGGNAQCASGVCDITCVQCRALPTQLGCNFTTQYCELGQCKSKKPLGGSCTLTSQCQSSLVCVSGQCRTPCSSHGQCPSSEWCSVLGACFADKALGASCVAGAECTTGVCDGFCRNCISVPTKQGCNFSTQYCEFNQCKTRKSVGSSCLFSDQCVAGLTCALGTCAKPCTTNANCLSSEWCDVLADGCMPDKANNVYCGTSDAQCISDVCDTTCEECRVLPTKKGCNFSTEYCEFTQCKAKKAIGESCSFKDQCLSDVCVLTTCRECNDDTDCASGEFCGSNTCKAKKSDGKACATKSECSSGCCKFFSCGC
jgi:hypothetical protein